MVLSDHDALHSSKHHQTAEHLTLKYEKRLFHFSTNVASHSMNFNLAIKIKPNLFLHEACLMIV